MHQAARQQFHPAALLTHRAPRTTANQTLYIEFEARFHEWKIARAQPHRNIALEYGAQQRLHEEDQVRHRNIAIDHHAFELIESMLVRSVDFFVTEDSPGRDHAQRRSEFAHTA